MRKEVRRGMEKKLKDLSECYFESRWETEKYIRELLPLEINYLKSRNAFYQVTETDILVQLVGFSWEPLFISLCAYQPDILVLVLNKIYNNQSGNKRGLDYKEHINKLMEADLITNEPKIISNIVGDTPESVFKLLREKVLPYINEGKRVVIDITGAKKTMVSGAYLFATYSNSLVSYLDFEKYNGEFGKPYGYTCVIKKPENPVEMFKLAEWLRVEEQYTRYAFGNSLRIISDVEEETKKFIGAEGEKAIDLLGECLHFYEVWENGDYRAALEKYKEIKKKIPSFPCLSAVQELGEIWFSNEDPLNTIKLIEGRDNLNQSIYLQDRKIIVYAQDEIGKVDRLIRYKEDYRSALLRAIGLNDFLFKARLIRLWVNNQLQINRDEKTSVRGSLDESCQKEIDEILLSYSTLSSVIKFLRKQKPLTLREKKGKLYYIDEAPVMDEFWRGQKCLNLKIPFHLFELRHKVIHFCLSVSEEIANAALKLAKANLDELQKSWVTEERIAGGEYEALHWGDLCEQCGINFLPRRG
ncbi:MAG TPA: hypothetical protein GXZ50_08145 [Clostridia bacterium]|nr:hypothetical protein [Clostridia bacterium]